MNTDDYIRIPFAERGRVREGADCWGLACIIYKQELDIELPSLIEYCHTKDKVNISTIIKSETQLWERVELGDERPFDIAVFLMLGQPMHVGIVTEPGKMIHCERGSGVYVTHYSKEQQWCNRLEGFFRYAQRSGCSAPIQSPS